MRPMPQPGAPYGFGELTMPQFTHADRVQHFKMKLVCVEKEASPKDKKPEQMDKQAINGHVFNQDSAACLLRVK